MLQILDTGISSAETNMRFDEELLNQLDPNGDPILHLYQWSAPSVTFGYFVRPEKHLDLGKAKIHGLELAQRSTGGGIIFHIWDLAFSFLMPSNHPSFSLNTLENYRFVNQAVLDAVKSYFNVEGQLIPENGEEKGADCSHFCMAKPTKYDVVWDGMKIAGAAQRRRKQGYLHQGSISLLNPNVDLLKEILLSKEEVLAAMMYFSFTPLRNQIEKLPLVRLDLQKLLADKLSAALK